MIRTLLVLLTLLSLCAAWELEETGLCIARQGTCSDGLQRYGVCCRVGNQLLEFKNYCLACQAGCSVWKYKRSSSEACR